MKVLALFSGGLDSTLAVKVMLKQGIEVIAVHFFSPFCTCSKKGCASNASKTAQALKIELITKFLGQEYLDIVTNPKYGYGKNLNPCIDCRILLMKKCKELMPKLGASFVITGEVLGQRPKSQHRTALKIIEKESGMEGLVLRPLSAKLLASTIPEEMGWVERANLLDFCGRTRKPQIKLAACLGIQDYPCPAGGCLLTYPDFSRKVKDLIFHGQLNLENTKVLKLGRHFRLSPQAKLVVGRDEPENKLLQDLTKAGDWIFAPAQVAGPIALGSGSFDARLLELSGRIICRYCDSAGRNGIDINYRRLPEKEEGNLMAYPAEEEIILKFRI